MIRPYRPADADAVQNVWAAASEVAHSFLSPEFQARERREMRDVYLPMAETWVWEDEGQVVGYISLLKNDVGAIFVDPRFQGRGIGRALMDRARSLRGELEAEVFENVRTYIQSGNVVFDSSARSASSLTKKISERIEERHGFRPHLFVLKREDLVAGTVEKLLSMATQPDS